MDTVQCVWLQYIDHYVRELADIVRRRGEEVNESGKTDNTAAARLLRLVLERSTVDFPSLIREPKEDLRSSCSEMTLQSSLGAPPRADPLELYPDEGSIEGELRRQRRIVACSGSISTSSSSMSGGLRLISERAYSRSR